MKKLRIAVLSPIHWRTPPRKQGAWELVASTITEELVKRGHDVTLYATADSVTKAKLKSIAPRPLLEEQGKDLETKVYGYLHAALPFEDAEQYDIIHNHYDGYPLVFSKLVKTPVVSTIHGFSSPQISKIYMQYNQTSYVSISDADRKHCPEMNWAATVYHGMDMTDLPYGPIAKDYVAFLGRVHPTKGVHLAIKAAKMAGVTMRIGAHIDDNDPAVLKYWKEECLPLIDGEQIKYLGELDVAGKSLLLREAQAVLCPIVWEEPFGLVFIEAMASGTPVIAFARGSVPELIEDGKTGFVIPADDLDAFAAAIPKARSLDRSYIRAQAEQRFSVGAMVDGYEAVYANLLGL